MKIYFINLDRHSLRREFMERQLAPASKTFEIRRQRAVEALDVNKKTIPINYDPYGKNAYVRSLTCFEVALFENHRSIWREIRDSEDEGAIILEDDIVLCSGFLKRVVDIADCLNVYPIIKLDGFYDLNSIFGPEEDFGNNVFRRILHLTASSAAYMVSKNFARHLLESTNDYCCPIDTFLFRPSYEYKAMQLFPAIAVQGMQSDPKIVIPKEIKKSQRHANDIPTEEGPATSVWRRYNKTKRDAYGFFLRAIHRNKYFGPPPLDHSLGEYNEDW